MTDKVQKIREEVERLQKRTEHNFDISLTGNERQFWLGESNVLTLIERYIDSLQEEPVSIWHDANQQPTIYRKYLVRYSDGRVSGSWERHDDGFIPWKDVVKEHKFTHWCYTEDLLKL